MKKIMSATFLLACFACSDGDLTIENIDFDDGTVEFCPLQFDQTDTERTLFFKIVEDEALILELQSGLLENAISAETITSNLESQSTLTYRLFSENVTDDYFCSDIPPSSPAVLEESVASAGTVNIVTTLDTVTSSEKTYAHTMDITDLTLVGGDNERITDEPGLDFGVYHTEVESSINQSFSNYADVTLTDCSSENGIITLAQSLNDEFIVLEFPSSILVDEVTTEPRTLALGTLLSDTMAVFSNHVFNRILNAENVCEELDDTTAAINTFTTVSGQFSVSTVEATDSTPENMIFNHTLTLSNFSFEDANGNTTGEISSYVFGTVATTTSSSN